MQVRDVMNPTVVSIAPQESVALAARLLARHNVGALPVCARDGTLHGMVTDPVSYTHLTLPTNREV